MDAFRELIFKCELEQLITERVAMQAENTFREYSGRAIAYSEDSFLRINDKIAQLSERVRNEG